MFFAWGGMTSGGYLGGRLFDLSLSYTLPFVAAGGLINLVTLVTLLEIGTRAKAVATA